MKFRIPLIVFVFVIMPTVILSMVAVKSLESWELILRERLKQQAEEAIRTVISEIDPVLRDNLTLVSTMMSDSVSRSARYDNTKVAAHKLIESAPLLDEVYLFMNPWGFLYPQEQDNDQDNPDMLRPGWDYIPVGRAEEEISRAEAPSLRQGYGGQASAPKRNEKGAERILDTKSATQLFSVNSVCSVRDISHTSDNLVSALRKEIVFGSADNMIKFSLDGFCYCFSRMGERRNLYAGYRINPSAFSAMLEQSLSGAEGPWFNLMADGPFPSEYQELIVEDSFSSTKVDVPVVSPLETFLRTETDPTLAVIRLPAPFDFIVLKAIMKNPEQAMRAGKMRKSLYMWGILVLAAGVLAGTWLMARESAVEIKRAKMKGDFLMGISHDLRTPAASIKMLSDSLYHGTVRDEHKKEKFLAVISRESERLNQLIERVIFFVRMGEDALSFNLQERDIGETVRKAVADFRARHGQEIKVEVKVEENLPKVKIDDDAISQVILNLLDNAQKYSENKG